MRFVRCAIARGGTIAAMTITPGKLMTADELLALPADHLRHELVEGKLTTTAPAGGEHGSIVVRLSVRLGHYIYQQKLG